MSIPRRDPQFTAADLAAAGEKFLKAGKEYWEACHKSGLVDGAVVWLSGENGHMAVFTRGEYRQQLVGNIERLGPTYQFGSAKP